MNCPQVIAHANIRRDITKQSGSHRTMIQLLKSNGKPALIVGTRISLPGETATFNSTVTLDGMALKKLKAMLNEHMDLLNALPDPAHREDAMTCPRCKNESCVCVCEVCRVRRKTTKEL